LGDSMTVGFEVPQEKVFTRVMEEELDHSGRPCEVINAGCRGWGTDQSLIFLEREGLKYEPDLVIYCYAANDPVDNTELHRPYRAFGKAYFALGTDGQLKLCNTPVPHYAPGDVVYIDNSGGVVRQVCSAAQSRWLSLRDHVVCRSSACTLTLQALAS